MEQGLWKRLRARWKGEGGTVSRYLPAVLVCTGFTLRLISTALQSFHLFLPVKRFCRTSNLNLPTCDFWPLLLALLPGTTEKGWSLPGKEALLILPAGLLPCWLCLSSQQDPREQHLLPDLGFSWMLLTMAMAPGMGCSVLQFLLRENR